MNKLLAILAQIAPVAATFAPSAGAIPEVVVAVAALLKYISDQNGMTTDEILAKAGVTLDQNEKDLLEDQLRLAGG